MNEHIGYKVISAEDARKISFEHRKDFIRCKAQPIFKLIHEAINRGEYSVSFYDGYSEHDILDNEIIAFLKELGYYYAFDGNKDVISWK